MKPLFGNDDKLLFAEDEKIAETIDPQKPQELISRLYHFSTHLRRNMKTLWKERNKHLLW